MMKILENWAKNEKRKEKISRSLKNYHAIKKAEKGYHRVYVTDMGKRVGYYLLPNLY